MEKSETKNSNATSKCPLGLCDGSGVIFDEKGISARPCECVKILSRQSKLKFANVPEEFKELKVGEFDTELYETEENRSLARSAKKWAIEYVKKFDVFKADGKGLYFYSNEKGSGKTRLMISIGNALISMYNMSVKFVTANELLDNIRFSFGKKSEEDNTYEMLMRDIKEIDILLLDDVGAERPSDWVNDVFYSILNDRMDDEETLGMAFGSVTGNFMREWVVPELDAYRFAKYAGTSGISSATAAALTKDTIIGAIDEATAAMDGDEVPSEGRILYVNSDLKPTLNAALSRQWGSDSEANTVLSGYNGMKIIYVPKTRFYTKITLNDGSSAWGYAKDGTDGKAINFMMIHPTAVVQANKFAVPKIFTPDENQKMDAWLFKFRLYHDCFVYDNKKKGIYLHANTK